MKSSSDYSTPLKPNPKETMNFEINYIEHVDSHEFDSNQNYASPPKEIKELSTDLKEKESVYSKIDSPQTQTEKEETKVKKTEKHHFYYFYLKFETEQSPQTEEKKEPNIKAERKLNFNPSYEPTIIEPTKNIFKSNSGPE